MIIAVTGHRPHKLGKEYDYKGPYSDYIGKEFDRILLEYNPEKIISGMAIGVDTLWAISGLYQNIPLIAAIPFELQETRWNNEAQDLYNKILDHPLCEKKFVNYGEYLAWKMQRRNEWMVDNCDLLVAVFDGSAGGTANCVHYAKEKNREILYIDPRKAIE